MPQSEPFEFKIPFEDTFSASPPSIKDVLKRLKDAVSEKLVDHSVSSIKLPSREIVLAAAEKAFDVYIGSVDFPQIPNLIEPFIKSAAKSVFLKFVGAMYDHLAA